MLPGDGSVPLAQYFPTCGKYMPEFEKKGKTSKKWGKNVYRLKGT
jgi:hypothetical protein